MCFSPCVVFEGSNVFMMIIIQFVIIECVMDVCIQLVYIFRSSSELFDFECSVIYVYLDFPAYTKRNGIYYLLTDPTRVSYNGRYMKL